MKLDILCKKIFKDYPDVVDLEQMRAMLGIGRNKAYELLQHKIIPSKRIGKRYIIAKIHIIEFIMKDQL